MEEYLTAEQVLLELDWMVEDNKCNPAIRDAIKNEYRKSGKITALVAIKTLMYLIPVTMFKRVKKEPK